MAAPQSTRPRFAGYTPLPSPHANVWLQVIRHVDDTASLYYRGTPADLVAANVITDEELAAPARKGGGKRDTEGHRFRIERVRGRPWIQVVRFGPLDHAFAFPGAAELLRYAVTPADRLHAMRPLPRLSRALERRYPGVKVSAYLYASGSSIDTQGISFRGPDDLLARYALAKRDCDGHIVHHEPIEEPDRWRRKDEATVARIIRRLQRQSRSL